MTTTQIVTSGPVPRDHARRAVPIVADLLPAEIVEHRRGRAARRIVLAGLVVLVVLFGAWYGVALYQTSSARQALSRVEDDVSRLQAQQNRYADVVGAEAESKKIDSALAALMADDLQWSKVMGAIRRAAPEGVVPNQVIGDLSTGTGNSASAAGGAVDLPNESGHKIIGKITIAGTAGSKGQVGAYVDALAKVDGLTDVLLVSTNADDGTTKFNLQASLTDAVLGGRFSAKTTGPGAK